MDDLEVGDSVVFKGDAKPYPVVFVGPKYFHVQLSSGEASGPYWYELIDTVIKP